MAKTFRALTAALLLAAVPGVARADAVEDFYKGRQVNLIVGSGTGGGYDSYARLVARHIGRHIPGAPSVVVQNMPGAGSLNMTNFVYNVAPKDGATLGACQNNVAFEPLFHTLSPGGKTARFDALKFNWIGSAAKENFIPFVMSDTGVTTFEELQAKPLRFGASAPSTDNAILALMLNRVFNTKIEIIHGYPGSTASLIVALEQKEIDGLAGMPMASLRVNASHLMNANRIRFLVQVGMNKHPDLPDVPLLIDLAKNPQDKEMLKAIIARYEMARPVFAAPGVPAERVAALRRAFEAAVGDPALLKDAATQGLDIHLVKGEEIEAMVASAYRLPPDLIERVKAAINLEK
ncbi:MAG: Bug family tripartite tricarboxylate transporter substrate binding protein [Beijerinckiaceae bacterium]